MNKRENMYQFRFLIHIQDRLLDELLMNQQRTVICLTRSAFLFGVLR